MNRYGEMLMNILVQNNKQSLFKEISCVMEERKLIVLRML